MHVHFIQHESFEAPGAYLNWAEKRGHTTTFSRVYEQEALPVDMRGIDMLIVMGGPQSPGTSLQECPHFDAAAEKHVIQQCIQAGKIVVGVCLGAQLIGEALGAAYAHSPEKEIGVFPITLTPAGLQDKKVRHFGSNLLVGHWHNDMPGLTATAEVLAVSEGCPRQIVRYAPLVYGLQCHMEFTPGLVDLLIDSEQDWETLALQHRYVQLPSKIRSVGYEDMNVCLFGFLDELSTEYYMMR
ncbi:GMP synthase (glutamine-hydrolysing) [Chitinophaga skermanii]|uniref:GMP synthase (Glutamine-hydrolysing) n=1 Tax=Chitinophaga skermanii TaxID=331697 RepID=A0A327PZ75_9BACT|nr:type 1 glutamine amidotransferase [Chitinophaga skermanii]RAI97545.1 GMP synthase (glutamine-hydrolysing) [Chitinophaga skermanii]